MPTLNGIPYHFLLGILSGATMVVLNGVLNSLFTIHDYALALLGPKHPALYFPLLYASDNFVSASFLESKERIPLIVACLGFIELNSVVTTGIKRQIL